LETGVYHSQKTFFDMELNDYTNFGALSLGSSLQMLEKLPEAYLILSPDKKILAATDAYLNAMGLSRTSGQLSDLATVFNLYNTSNPQLSDRVSKALDEVIEMGQRRTIDAQSIRHRYYEIIQTPIFDEHQKIIFIIHKLLNVTRLIRKEFEFENRIADDIKRMKDTTDMLARVEAAGSTGSYQFDLQTKRIIFSDGMYCLLGYEPGSFEPTFEFLQSISYKDDDEVVNGIIAAAVDSKTGYEYTRRIIKPDGKMRYIYSKGKVLKDEAGNALSVLGVSHDITELEVFKASIRTQEEERRRMADDLRNGIGQVLYAAKINLKHLESKRAMNDPAGFERAKQLTDKILTDAIKEVRRLSHHMTPAILEDFGLEETIIELCKQFNPDVNVSCKVTGLTSRLDLDLEVSIYRMVQELLLNVVNHAQASEAIIEVKQEGVELFILVQDNGIGYDSSQGRNFGLGLSALMNKVRLLNGTINIEADAGTKVSIKLPLE
jgi:signal transduction histidine kinase